MARPTYQSSIHWSLLLDLWPIFTATGLSKFFPLSPFATFVSHMHKQLSLFSFSQEKLYSYTNLSLSLSLTVSLSLFLSSWTFMLSFVVLSSFVVPLTSDCMTNGNSYPFSSSCQSSNSLSLCSLVQLNVLNEWNRIKFAYKCTN